MKKAALTFLLISGLFLFGGCSSVKETLQSVSSSYTTNSVDTPESSSGDLDWSFVPVLRERAETTFTGAAPQATITNTIVTSKNGDDSHVVVVIEYELSGKSGSYGFEYKLEEGEYKLTRYGEGVTTDDIR